MANILLRSPHFEYHTQAGALSAMLELSLDGQLFYTLVKSVDGSNGVLFEISELARDYIDPQFSGTYDSETLPVDGVITFYDGINATGAVVGTTCDHSLTLDLMATHILRTLSKTINCRISYYNQTLSYMCLMESQG